MRILGGWYEWRRQRKWFNRHYVKSRKKKQKKNWFRAQRVRFWISHTQTLLTEIDSRTWAYIRPGSCFALIETYNIKGKWRVFFRQIWKIAYVIDDVSKLIMDGMKLSFWRIDRMVFQSGAVSGSGVALNSKHIDSSANFTTAGGLAIDRTSANWFFLMPLTAKNCLGHSRGQIIHIYVGFIHLD